jgi:hypothetical protein
MTVPMALMGVPTLLCDEEMMSFDNSVQPESPIMRSPSPATPPLLAESSLLESSTLAHPWDAITVSYHEI